jgi:hypothetical protein
MESSVVQVHKIHPAGNVWKSPYSAKFRRKQTDIPAYSDQIIIPCAQIAAKSPKV